MAKEKNQGKKKPIGNVIRIAVFVVLTALALFYVLKDNKDPGKTFELIQSIDFVPFTIALVLIIFLVFLDSLSLTLFTKIYQPKYRLSQGFINAIIGSFFASFNKASSQVVQAYTLTKQGVQSSRSASILTMHFIMYQLSLTLYSVVMVIVGYPIVKDIPLFSSLPIFYVSLIALLLDVFFLIGLILIAFCHPFHQFLLQIGVRFLSLFSKHIDVEEKKKEWVMKLATYHIETRRLFKHIGTDIAVLLINLVRQFLINCLPFFVYYCLHASLDSSSFFSFLSGASYLNMITAIIPSGAPEVGFSVIFSYLYPIADSQSMTSAAVLIWRFLTFYFSLIIGGLMFFFYHGSPKDEVRNYHNETFYDFQVINYDMTVIVNKETMKEEESPLLKNFSSKDVQASFEKINRSLKVRTNKEEKSEDQPITLSIQKAQLAKVLQEADALRKEKESLNQEIENEANDDLSKLNERERLRKARKAEKRRKKLEAKYKTEKEIEDEVSYGTSMIYQENGGLFFQNGDMEIYRTYTSHDETETIDELDDTKEATKGDEE